MGRTSFEKLTTVAGSMVGVLVGGTGVAVSVGVGVLVGTWVGKIFAGRLTHDNKSPIINIPIVNLGFNYASLFFNKTLDFPGSCVES